MGRYMTPSITLTGYTVQYVDMREPKPRETHTEIFVLDADTIEALTRTGQNVVDFIRHRYEVGGYTAFSVEKVTRKEAVLDLQIIWENTR